MVVGGVEWYKKVKLWANVPQPKSFFATHSLTPFTIAPLWWIAAIIDINPATYSTFSIQSVHSQVSHSLLWSVNRTAKLQRQLILYQYECNLAVGSWDPKFAAVQHEPRTIPAGNQNPRQTKKQKTKKVKNQALLEYWECNCVFFWKCNPFVWQWNLSTPEWNHGSIGDLGDSRPRRQPLYTLQQQVQFGTNRISTTSLCNNSNQQQDLCNGYGHDSTTGNVRIGKIGNGCIVVAASFNNVGVNNVNITKMTRTTALPKPTAAVPKRMPKWLPMPKRM